MVGHKTTIKKTHQNIELVISLHQITRVKMSIGPLMIIILKTKLTLLDFRQYLRLSMDRTCDLPIESRLLYPQTKVVNCTETNSLSNLIFFTALLNQASSTKTNKHTHKHTKTQQHTNTQTNIHTNTHTQSNLLKISAKSENIYFLFTTSLTK